MAVPFCLERGDTVRKLMWFTIGFTAACALGAYVYTPWLWFIALIGLCIFGVAMLLRKKWKLLPFLAAVFLGLSVGLCWFGVYRQLYLSPAAEADGQELTLTAEITDFSVPTEYGTTAKGIVHLEQKSYQVILYLKEDRELVPGDKITGTFRLRMTHEGLEGDTYHRGNGIFLLAYAKDKTEFQPSEGNELRHFPARLRRAITERLETVFPKDTAFFAKALLLGDRSDVDYETNTAFKVSGISHMIAVSGLHVSILFAVIFVISGRKRPITALIGIPILILFAAVTGFTPSVTRACVMQILFILADCFLKEYDSPTALSAAVLLMLMLNPVSVASASLQLSVGCMAGIFMFSEKIQSWICSFKLWKQWKGKSFKVRLRNRLASGVSVTFSAMFFTTPLVACYFGCVSLVSVLTNLLTLWAVSWIFYGIMLVCLISLFGNQCALFLAWGVSWLIRYVLTVSKALAAIPLAAVYTKSIFIIVWLVLCYLLVFAFLFWKRKRPYLLICTGLISLTAALLVSWLWPMTDHCRMTVLDVGQGQSIILQSQGKTYLVDCGGDRPEEAADQAAETLLSMGIYRLDGVILTHYDSDHAGGIPYLLSRIPADTVFLPDPAEEEVNKQTVLTAAGETALFVHQDLELGWDETKMTIFAPLSYADDNESGLSVLFRGNNCDILITGDMRSTAENKLLLEKDIPQLTALVAGHHGSPYSTGAGLLAMTKPQYVFISVGEDNRYGHPSQQVLDLLEEYRCIVYRTDLDGTVVFRR